jgi:hypothetical protein
MSSYSAYPYPTPPSTERAAPAASMAGTAAFLVGLAFAYQVSAVATTPTSIAQAAATPVAIALAVSLLFDAKRGLRNIFRADVLCLIGLYFLTLAEFLFPQLDFDTRLSAEQASKGIAVILLGLGSLAIGRHLVAPTAMKASWLNFGSISNALLFRIFIGSAFLGFLYMLISVNFDIVAMTNAMLGARFTQPWGRGRLGGWLTFITELALLLNIIPPLAGVIWNRRQGFPKWQLGLVVPIFLYTLFHGFAGGTRNVFVAYLATFLIGYLLTLPKNNFANTVIPAALVIVMAAVGSYHMLEFRTIGLRNYVQNGVYESGTGRETLAVDYNLAAIGLIADTFPEQHDFLGMEVLTWAIVKPIPRVLWSGKPEGLSVSIEEILGAQGFTVASTYLGECFMMGGYGAVIGMSLFFGAVAAWWNRLALQRHSDYAMLIYAIGFLTAAITMRSMFWFTTVILPVVCIVLLRRVGILR